MTEISEEQIKVAKIFITQGMALEQSRVISLLSENADKITDAQSAINLILGK